MASQSPYSSDTCMFCHQLLRITADPNLESDPEDVETVIDDVELHCSPPGPGPSGHHAHWACLIDHAKNSPRDSDSPLPTCPVCGQRTRDASGRFLVDVRNEGGETLGFDFGEMLDEELFLEAHPNQVHIRAFHDLIAGGDYAGAIELLAEHDVDINGTYGREGLTALQKAVFNGDTCGVQFLTSLGAAV